MAIEGWKLYFLNKKRVEVIDLKRIIAFTGAGISKESGIPTFEEMGDLREKLSREYATLFPEEYRHLIISLKNLCDTAEPNDAHYALAEYDIPVITMNIDGLHRKAGTKILVEIHGALPDDSELMFCEMLYNKPVLYGDNAPLYTKAISMIDSLDKGDILLIVGASNYSGIANELRYFAISSGIEVVEIQKDATTEVRKILENLTK